MGWLPTFSPVTRTCEQIPFCRTRSCKSWRLRARASTGHGQYTVYGIVLGTGCVQISTGGIGGEQVPAWGMNICPWTARSTKQKRNGPLPGIYIPERAESRDSNRRLYTDVHRSTLRESQKVEITQINRWVDKQIMVSVYTFHHIYKGILSHHKEEWNSNKAASWTNLENMLNERNQTRKDKYCVIPLMSGTWNSQIHSGRKWNRDY